MGTTSEGTEGYVKEDIQPKRVIGFCPSLWLDGMK